MNAASLIDYLKDKRILTMIVIVLALLALDLVYGIHLGIEFIGGTQIPITLEHQVNVTTMGSMISALQQRISTFGLKEITVEGIGSSEIFVTIPTVSSAEINQTIAVIQSQGRFQGIINGSEALNGSGILKGSIGIVPPTLQNNTYYWQVPFYLTQQAAPRFAKVAMGHANQPIYLFLDRPSSTVVLINASELTGHVILTRALTANQVLSAMRLALSLGNSTIPVLPVYDTNSSVSEAESFIVSNLTRYSKVIASSNLNQSLISFLESQNITLVEEPKANMSPSLELLVNNQAVLDAWPVVGLLSSPILQSGLTNGNLTSSQVIQGYAPTNMSAVKQYDYAQNQSKTISSILSGGALPVSIIAGQPTTIPPTLGSYFLYVSGIAGLVAVVSLSTFIVIRYRKLFLVAPILLTTLMELFIILSIIGLIGTIDLAAVAGMIAVVGTGVDAQIIITDEILNRKGEAVTAKTAMGNAFYIIWADAALLVIAMLPLFFSTSLVTVIGFSESTIIGALLGVLITRPAYSAIISRHYAQQ